LLLYDVLMDVGSLDGCIVDHRGSVLHDFGSVSI